MTVETALGVSIDSAIVRDYFKYLVDHFFKILPMREQEEPTLPVYIESLQMELLGGQSLILSLTNCPEYMTLINILQFLRDNPACSIRKVKREVFRAISICYKLNSKYEETKRRKTNECMG